MITEDVQKSHNLFTLCKQLVVSNLTRVTFSSAHFSSSPEKNAGSFFPYPAKFT